MKMHAKANIDPCCVVYCAIPSTSVMNPPSETMHVSKSTHSSELSYTVSGSNNVMTEPEIAQNEMERYIIHLGS